MVEFKKKIMPTPLFSHFRVLIRHLRILRLNFNGLTFVHTIPLPLNFLIKILPFSHDLILQRLKTWELWVTWAKYFHFQIWNIHVTVYVAYLDEELWVREA